MMKHVVFFVYLTALVISCKKKDDEPVFPIEPYVEFREITFLPGKANHYPYADTVNISFYFRDGDFDLGLDVSLRSLEPFNSIFYFLKSNGQPIADVRFENGEFDASELIRFSDKRTNSIDTLPPFTTPFSCTHWVIDSVGQGIDTLYFANNPNHFNIEINIDTVDQNGNSSLFDFSTALVYPNCHPTGFNNIFPPLWNAEQAIYNPFSWRKISQKEGIMTYSIRSAGWSFLFGGKKIKFSVRIRDRALHVSNTIETSEIAIP